jgi:hypothetical protein
MYESYRQPMITRRAYLIRQARSILFASGLLGLSLALGIAGYMAFDQLSLVDAFLNASMILGGMGPVAPLTNDTAKWFAGLYALYSGIIFLVAVGVIAAPAYHRFLHRLHLDDDSDDDADQPAMTRRSDSPIPSNE